MYNAGALAFKGVPAVTAVCVVPVPPVVGADPWEVDPVVACSVGHAHPVLCEVRCACRPVLAGSALLPSRAALPSRGA